MTIKTKVLISLILLGIVDMAIPFPIVGAILIYVLLQKPSWFHKVVEQIYSNHSKP